MRKVRTRELTRQAQSVDIDIHIVSSHPLITALVPYLLVRTRGLRGRVSPKPCPEPKLIPPQSQPCLFVLDKYSAPMELPCLCRMLRSRCPGSKFLALLAPDTASDEELLELLYLGIEGLLKLSDRMEEELPRAVQAVLSGTLWVPQHIILKYVQQTNLLLEAKLRPESPLTARENQILHLLVRRLSNREISGALDISERTVKFHISNIFTKTQVQDRRELLASISAAWEPRALSI